MEITVDNEEKEPKLFVGIDQSYSGFGIVVLDDHGTLVLTELWSFPPSKLAGIGLNSDGVRLNKIYSQFSNWLFDLLYGYGKFNDSTIDFDNICIAMEGYSYGSVLNREKMGELGAIVKMAIAANDKAPRIIAPSELKKFMTGNGNASKEDMVNAVQKLEPSITNHNLADAYALAYMYRQSMC